MSIFNIDIPVTNEQIPASDAVTIRRGRGRPKRWFNEKPKIQAKRS